MLLPDVGAYLAATTLGLSFGSTGNLFIVPIPETAPDRSVSVLEYSGASSVRAFSTGNPVAERPRFQVVVREELNNFASGRQLAEDIHAALDGLGTTTMESGTRWLFVRALQPPFYLSEDGGAQHRWITNYEAMKE